MANSSDWMEVLSGSAPDQAPSAVDQESASEPAWIAALRRPAQFVEGIDFAPADAPGQAENLDRADRLAPSPMPPASAATSASPGQAALGPLEQAFEDGHTQGYELGYSAGQAEAQTEAQTKLEDERAKHAEQARAVQALRLNFRSLDQAANDAVAAELADTVVVLCRRVLADFAVDPDILLGHCQAAASRLGSAASQCKLHLNPDDLAALDPAMLEQWNVVEDDTIARGALRFEAPDGAVSYGPDDWARAIAAAIRG